MSNVEQMMGKLMWDMGRAEQGGLSTVSMLSDASRLTDAERYFIVDHMIPDEQRHTRVTWDWARRWAPWPQMGDYGAAITRDVMAGSEMTGVSQLAWLFALLHWNERNTVRAYTTMLPLYEKISHSLAYDLRGVLEDERLHVVWGDMVLARIAVEDEEMARRITVAAKLIKRVYPVIVHRTFFAKHRALSRAMGLPYASTANRADDRSAGDRGRLEESL